MKITYLRLKNYIGIYNGLSINNLEIDFKKAKDRITLLVGPNGSAKTTILSTLHPFHNTMDNRNNIILEGKNGYKEIHFKDGKNKFIIKHIYNKNKSIKSYIELKNEEGSNKLNPTGNVTSFKDIVEEYLNVKPSYFKLARIGTNVTNFIEMKTAERKKFLSLLLPDVSDYLEYYKNASEKFTYYKKKINELVDKKNKFEDKEVLKENISLLKDQIENLNIDLEKNISKKTKYETKYENLNEDDSLINKKNEIIKQLNVIKLFFDDNNLNMDDYNDIDEIKSNIEELKMKYDKYYSSYIKKKTRKKSLVSEIDYIIKLKQKIDAKILDSEELEENISKYKTTIEKNNLELDKLNKYDFNLPVKILKDEDIDEIFYKFKSLLYIIDDIEYYNYNNIEEVIDNFNKNINYGKKINDLNENIQKLSTILEKERNERAYYKSKIEDSSILDKRPKECKIDTCYFIKKALESKEYESKLEEVNDSYTNHLKSLKEYEETLKKYDEMNKISILLNKFLDGYSKIEFLNKINYDNKNIRTKIKIVKNYITYEFKYKEYKFTLNDLLDIINHEEEMIKIKNQNELLNSRLKLLVNKSENKDENFKNQKELKEKINLLKEELDKINLDDIYQDYMDIKNKLELYENILENKNKIIELKKEYNNIKEDLSKVDVYIEKIDKYNDKINHVKSQIEELKEKYEDKIYKIRLIDEYEKEEKELNDYYNNIKVLRDALSPTTGIPLLYLQNYLENIRNNANDLLNYTFKENKFYIYEFILNDKEFLIKVRKQNGEIVDDISEASQGEQALVSLTLSLAIIKESITKYNILLLDEIDAVLDTKNRNGFLKILNKQLDLLNNKQTFIISHNQCFDSYQTGLIMLKSEVMNDYDLTNKNIIYKN